MNLVAIFQSNRNLTGALEVWHDGAKLADFPCLGKADNDMAAKKRNPSRNPERPYGDTPTGLWKVYVSIIAQDKDTYGPGPLLLMTPISGQAIKAYKAPNPRSGILIHGGNLGAAGQLRPTYGCIRVHNETMARLHEFIRQHGQIQTLETKEV